MAAPGRVAISIAKTGVLISSWAGLSFVMYLLIGGPVDQTSRLSFSVAGCHHSPVLEGYAVEFLDAGHEKAAGVWGGKLIVEQLGRESEQENSPEAVSRIVQTLDEQGCEIEEFYIFQELEHDKSKLALSLLSSCILIYLFVVRIWSSVPSQPPEIKFKHVFWSIAIGALLAVVSTAIVASIVADSTNVSGFGLGGSDMLSVLLIGVVAMPLTEEVVFRRMALQIWINERLSWLGVVLVSISFSGLHLVANLTGSFPFLVAVAAFVLSVAAGIAYRLFGLPSAVSLHATYNATVLVPLAMS